jgi:hypothetical protein
MSAVEEELAAFRRRLIVARAGTAIAMGLTR